MARGGSSSASSRRPLTIPLNLEIRNGIEYLTFTYTSKGVSTPYTIRIDIESIDNTPSSSTQPHNNTNDAGNTTNDTTTKPSPFTDEFKTTNAVYPRANIDPSKYTGNRWQYESSVNEIGWRLAFLNPILIGKRGLLQRAVDRNRFPLMKSRRVARLEKQDTQPTPSATNPSTHPTNTSSSATDTDTESQGVPVLPHRNPPDLVKSLVSKSTTSSVYRNKSNTTRLSSSAVKPGSVGTRIMYAPGTYRPGMIYPQSRQKSQQDGQDGASTSNVIPPSVVIDTILNESPLRIRIHTDIPSITVSPPNTTHNPSRPVASAPDSTYTSRTASQIRSRAGINLSQLAATRNTISQYIVSQNTGIMTESRCLLQRGVDTVMMNGGYSLVGMGTNVNAGSIGYMRMAKRVADEFDKMMGAVKQN